MQKFAIRTSSLRQATNDSKVRARKAINAFWSSVGITLFGFECLALLPQTNIHLATRTVFAALLSAIAVHMIRHVGISHAPIRIACVILMTAMFLITPGR